MDTTSDMKGTKWRDRETERTWTWVTGPVTRQTGIAFVRGGEIVHLPYATLRSKGAYLHVALEDLRGPGWEALG